MNPASGCRNAECLLQSQVDVIGQTDGSVRVKGERGC